MTDQTDTSTETTSSTETEPTDTGNREAAKYRRQLREAEAERDQLRSTIDAMRRRAIEDIAARDHRVAKPEALWNAGADLTEMLADDGQLNLDAVNGWITASVEELGLAQKRSGPYVSREGSNPRPPASATTWGQFLNNPEN